MEGFSTKRRKSGIWCYFTAIDTEFAKCTFCSGKFSYKTSISNLKKHLLKKHLTIDETAITTDSDVPKVVILTNPETPKEDDLSLNLEESAACATITCEGSREISVKTVPKKLKPLKELGASSWMCLPRPNSDMALNDSINKLEKIASEMSKSKEKLTEFDLWAKSLAVQMNAMEIRRALQLQLKLQTIITEERILFETPQT